MGRRQAQQAQAMQLALSQSAQELLQRIHRARAAGADPFAGMTMRELMRASAEAGRAFAQVVQVERLARGASTQNIGGHDGGPLSAQHEEARAWAASASRTELDAFLTGVDAGRERERHAQQKDAARRPRNSPTTQE